MKNETHTIGCPLCKEDIGTVTLEAVTDRPGFYRNVCTPDPLPTRCAKCEGILTRKLEGIWGTLSETSADLWKGKPLKSLQKEKK